MKKKEVALQKACAASCHPGNRWLPARSDFFERNKTDPDGFSPICRNCQFEMQQHRLRQRDKEYSQIALSHLKTLARQGKDVPDLNRLLVEVFKINGPDKFAQMYWHQYHKAEDGSPEKINALKAIFQMTAKNQVLNGSAGELSSMSEEELDKEIEKYENALAQQIGMASSAELEDLERGVMPPQKLIEEVETSVKD